MWGRMINFPPAHIIVKGDNTQGDLWLGDYFAATDINFIQ